MWVSYLIVLRVFKAIVSANIGRNLLDGRHVASLSLSTLPCFENHTLTHTIIFFAHLDLSNYTNVYV